MTHEVDERAGGVVVAVQGGALGGPDGAQLYETLQALQDQGHGRVVLDLRGLTRINPRGLGLFIAGLALLRNGGGELRFAHLPDAMHSLLVITQLRASVPCFDSVEAALAAD